MTLPSPRTKAGLRGTIRAGGGDPGGDDDDPGALTGLADGAHRGGDGGGAGHVERDHPHRRSGGRWLGTCRWVGGERAVFELGDDLLDQGVVAVMLVGLDGAHAAVGDEGVVAEWRTVRPARCGRWLVVRAASRGEPAYPCGTRRGARLGVAADLPGPVSSTSTNAIPLCSEPAIRAGAGHPAGEPSQQSGADLIELQDVTLDEGTQERAQRQG